MTRLLAAVALAALPCAGAWIEMKSGPFVVFSDAGDQPARTALTHLEQFRHALGQSMNKTDLKCRWPITIVVSRPGAAPPFLAFGRDGYIGSWPAGAAPPRAWFKTLALTLFDSSLTGRMPSGHEDALADLFSTLEVRITRLTLGTPPPPGERTLDWARLHMLATRPEYSGRLRVLLANLSLGSEEDPSYRNAFEKRRADLDVEAKAYLAAGVFSTIQVSGRPLDPERQFRPDPLSPARAALVAGDLLLARRSDPKATAQAYQTALNQNPSAAASEGYALALLAEGDKTAARSALLAATTGEGAGPRAFVELARLETDTAKAQALLEAALQRNPLWAEPWFLFAQREPGPNRRGLALKKTTELEPRNLAYWQAYAESQMGLKNFEEAARAWMAAARVAPEAQKASIHEARLAAEQRQLDQEAEERRRKLEQERSEVEKLRQENLASIRRAEEKTQSKTIQPGAKLDKWWDGPAGTRLSGTLDRVDCLGKQARLNVRGADGKVVQLMISDPGKVALIGQGQTTLSCGPQRPPRKVDVEYQPKTGGLGEVMLVEFK